MGTMQVEAFAVARLARGIFLLPGDSSGPVHF